MRKKIHGNTLNAIVGDITEQNTTVIVNAANGTLLGGGGVDGAIHKGAGPKLAEACQAVRERDLNGEELPTGEVVMTEGFNLQARFVIHTVGPIWNENPDLQEELLANCYRNVLELVKVNKLGSVAFPSISTGVFGYPIEKAAKIASQTIVDFLKENQVGEVNVVLFSDHDYDFYKRAIKNLF